MKTLIQNVALPKPWKLASFGLDLDNHLIACMTIGSGLTDFQQGEEDCRISVELVAPGKIDTVPDLNKFWAALADAGFGRIDNISDSLVHERLTENSTKYVISGKMYG